MKSIVRWAGQNGALIVIAGVVIGLVIPLLTAAARPYLAVAIFIFTFGSFLKFDVNSIGDEVSQAKRKLMVLWATFAVPLVIFLITVVTRPGAELTQGLLFWALVPASPACVAFAAILRLNISIALLATVLGTAASPFSAAAWQVGLGCLPVAIAGLVLETTHLAALTPFVWLLMLYTVTMAFCVCYIT